MLNQSGHSLVWAYTLSKIDISCLYAHILREYSYQVPFDLVVRIAGEVGIEYKIDKDLNDP